MALSSEQILLNLQNVRQRIFDAAKSADRDPKNVRLVAVTKKQPVDVIRALPTDLVAILGENYVGDTYQKQEALGESARLFQWHLIGTLQSRKTKYIPSLYTCMHSLDRLSIAKRLSREFTNIHSQLPVLLQLNVANEPTKSGWFLDFDKPSIDVLSEIDDVIHLPNLIVQGLMCMPPYSENPEDSRKYFVVLSKIQTLFSRHFHDCDFSELSMGTSFDFEVAVQEGATYVRIGEGIFGKRDMNV
jgi:pyridoxal phosphate enzyme (YggS family)